MNSMAFSLLANSNPEVDGSSGSIRLSDPAKPDPSASVTKTIAMSESSVGSSSEVNLPISFATLENTGEKMENSTKPWRILT
jgi:hypothetical protein